MFPEGKYYVTTTNNGVFIVRGFTMSEFFIEFRARGFGSFVSIASSIPMDSDEFEELAEIWEIECPEQLFDNGEFEEN
jgi:hypothetical protein